MIEHVLYSLFLVTFGMQIGRILTLYQEANKLARGIDALSKADWHGPQILAARIDNDQDAIGDLPARSLVVWSPPTRMPVWLEMQYEFRRWRVPRLRRAG